PGEPLAHQPGDENLVPKLQPASDAPLAMATPDGPAPTNSEVLPSNPSLPGIDKVRPELAPIPQGSLLTDASGIIAPSVGLTKVDVSAMPPPDIGTLVGKLGQNVSTYIPPIGSPIGSNPSAVSGESVRMVDDIVMAVDAVTKASGVKTDDGEYVTAPTTGYAYSTKYHFT
ncbi:MAG: hypothetical protein QF358_13050, partial [Arenicellales bacterium]|nr:hypothetical protein [Arenicellales bacterium]